MASLRKKPQRDANAPVMAPPQGGDARLPDPVAETKLPPELPDGKSPADRAGEHAMLLRLAEMDKAEALQKKPQPQQAQEPQAQQQPEMPAAVARFLAENPRFADPNDAIAQAEIYTATLKCNRDGKRWDQPDFVPTLERHLGLAPAGNGHVPERPVESRPPPQRPAAPPQRAASTPLSAPVSREPPSWKTGRATGHRAPLSRDELEIAAASGISPEQYQANKERWQRMKAEGHQ